MQVGGVGGDKGDNGRGGLMRVGVWGDNGREVMKDMKNIVAGG